MFSLAKIAKTASILLYLLIQHVTEDKGLSNLLKFRDALHNFFLGLGF